MPLNNLQRRCYTWNHGKPEFGNLKQIEEFNRIERVLTGGVEAAVIWSTWDGDSNPKARMSDIFYCLICERDILWDGGSIVCECPECETKYQYAKSGMAVYQSKKI